MAISLVGLGLGAYQIYKGEQSKKEAKELADKAGERPDYKIPQSEYDNLALLKSRAGQGLSDSTMNGLNSGNERGYSSAVRNILLGGGNANNVSDLYDKYNNSLTKIQLADDAAKTQNINNLIQQQSRMSGFADKEYQLNQLDPWKDNRQQANVLSAYGNNQTMAGAGTIGSTLIGAAGKYGRTEPGATTNQTTPAQNLYSMSSSMGNGNTEYRSMVFDNVDYSQVNPESRDSIAALFGSY